MSFSDDKLFAVGQVYLLNRKDWFQLSKMISVIVSVTIISQQKILQNHKRLLTTYSYSFNAWNHLVWLFIFRNCLFDRFSDFVVMVFLNRQLYGSYKMAHSINFFWYAWHGYSWYRLYDIVYDVEVWYRIYDMDHIIWIICYD